ncbi:hypothetical protein L7F22_065650 [Adiantum nelumboides]|nr:hypothetical protein [Adiantum nelumboides]
MGVNYMTRWAEATTTSRITAAIEVAKFIVEHICYRFGIPLEILSDRGPGFRGDIVGELMKKLKIKRRPSTPYYPQCNGLVEKFNEIWFELPPEINEDKKEGSSSIPHYEEREAGPEA